MRKNPASSPEFGPPVRSDSVLNPLVALIAHPDDAAASRFKDVFEDVACDWRLVRVTDGTAAARHVMNKGLPDLLIVCADLPEVSGPEFVEWLRSFRSARPLPILVYGEPAGDEARKHFLRHDVTCLVPVTCPRPTLAAHLEEFVSQVEKRRFASLA
jgi:CheY-like chemotaxis protein